MRFYIVVLLILILNGCTGPTMTYYLGAKEDPGRILPLPAQNATGLTWQDLYLRVDYDITRQGDQLLIEGNLSFSDYPKMNIAKVDKLTLTLYLLNDQGIVRKYLDLEKLLDANLQDHYPIKKEISIPADVTAISFGYDGELIRQMKGGSETIWKNPRRPS